MIPGEERQLLEEAENKIHQLKEVLTAPVIVIFELSFVALNFLHYGMNSYYHHHVHADENYFAFVQIHWLHIFPKKR